jgi:ABC-type branched-subunit amino acid transport system ATPase component
LNGAAGLSLVPSPLGGELNIQSTGYQVGYGVVAILLAFCVYRLVRRVTASPYGRSLRAMRDNDIVADSLGKNLRVLRTSMLVLGGALAGLSGGVLVGFINLWDPQAWGYAETIVLFAAVIIGGLGNHLGAVLGAVLVPLGFEEASRYIPAIGPPGLIPALQWVAIGLLIVLFLWFRPQGVLPERRRILSTATSSGAPGLISSEELAGSSEPEPLPVFQGATNGNGAALEPTAVPAVAARTPEAVDGSPAAERTPRGVMLEAVGLTREFGGVRAVDGVSITIQEGRLTGLIGPNGAGKSTTLAMLAGTLHPSSGRIYYRGADITSLPAFERARRGLVRTFQLASEFKRLTVLENLVTAVPAQSGDSFLGAMRGRRYWGAEERRNIERAEEMLVRFGLQALADRYAGDLSGGQRRLVEIMRALMAEPEVLLLDEPMAGVHPKLARQIGYQLLALCAGGMTIVMVEHELSIMDEFCDPVVVMAEGRVLAEGTMEQLRGRSEVVEAYLVG